MSSIRWTCDGDESEAMKANPHSKRLRSDSESIWRFREPTDSRSSGADASRTRDIQLAKLAL
ncbi:MAG: hypothetical protein KDA47_13735, partial [Planctomycetales bacterium]|nr:hypothetical protein [Planctomycetales bacterium]